MIHNMFLSKSQYCSAIQCPKMLWLKKNKPEVFDESVLNQAVLETGNEVGDLAMGLFGPFVEVPFGNLSEMIRQTKVLLAENTPVVTEASFSYQGLFCSVDILKNLGDRRVEIYEVKSSTEVKPIHYHDAAFQAYVLTKLGFTVGRVCIVHINNQYVRHGNLDLQQLFEIADVTVEARAMLPDVETNLERFSEYLAQTEEPADDIGTYCKDPYLCGFWGYCTRAICSPSVFDLYRLDFRKKIDLYRRSVVSFRDLVRESDVMNDIRQRQIEYALNDKGDYVDREHIRGFLAQLRYPLYFLDFETVQPAIPRYEGTKPYAQIPFQYSLHYIESEDGELKHLEFLAEPGTDPRRAIAERLCADIPADACVTAYYKKFECSRLQELADTFPDLAEHLLRIRDNIVDLLVPFQSGWYYNRAMGSSFSIKSVLPALFPADPSLDYHNLEEIHNGSEAMNAFPAMEQMSPEEQAQTRRNLLKYCELDTYAMVKVWQKLNEAVQS